MKLVDRFARLDRQRLTEHRGRLPHLDTSLLVTEAHSLVLLFWRRKCEFALAYIEQHAFAASLPELVQVGHLIEMENFFLVHFAFFGRRRQVFDRSFLHAEFWLERSVQKLEALLAVAHQRQVFMRVNVQLTRDKV